MDTILIVNLALIYRVPAFLGHSQFGDTVNMASRMESTSRRDCIQLSQATADLLVAAGKGHMIREREDMVRAKGKGELRTYWLGSGPGSVASGMETRSMLSADSCHG